MATDPFPDWQITWDSCNRPDCRQGFDLVSLILLFTCTGPLDTWRTAARGPRLLQSRSRSCNRGSHGAALALPNKARRVPSGKRAAENNIQLHAQHRVRFYPPVLRTHM